MAENKLSLQFENANDKAQLVAGLASLLVGDCGDFSAEKMSAAVTASGNVLDSSFVNVFSTAVEKMGIEKFIPAGGGGGGGGGGGAAAASDAPAEAKVEKPKEEEIDFSGGVNMFGGGEGGGDYVS
jgi:ribosomal protein L12E/L44/L45/RPP1/RPP2